MNNANSSNEIFSYDLELRSILQEFTNTIYFPLLKFAKEKDLIGKFTGGVMPGKESGSGSVFYLPNSDPNEEGIGAEWDVKKNPEKTHGILDIWLGWTHGAVIKEYCENIPFSWKSENDIIINLRPLLWKYEKEIIDDLKKEIVIPRKPYYRVD